MARQSESKSSRTTQARANSSRACSSKMESASDYCGRASKSTKSKKANRKSK